MIQPKCLLHYLQCQCIIYSVKVQFVANVLDPSMGVSQGYRETPASRMKTNDSTSGTPLPPHTASLAVSSRVSPCTNQLVITTMHNDADQ